MDNEPGGEAADIQAVWDSDDAQLKLDKLRSILVARDEAYAIVRDLELKLKSAKFKLKCRQQEYDEAVAFERRRVRRQKEGEGNGQAPGVDR